MRPNLEDDLTRTFRAAALAAPDPGPEFPAAVATRQRRRTRTRMAGGVAAVTTAIAVAAGVAVLDPTAVGHIEPAQPLDARPLAIGSPPNVDLSAARPYREVWPEALVELTYPLPDRRPYSVEAALGSDSYLALPYDGRGAPSLPVVLSARTGAVRELATVPASGYTSYEVTGLFVTEHHIAWTVSAEETGGARYGEVWSAPKGGGAAARRARFGPDNHVMVSAAEVRGVFYAGVRAFPGIGTVYRIPDGGAPVKVPGGDGYVLQHGPWAVPHPAETSDPLELLRTPQAGGHDGEVPTFWNVATGERRTPRTFHGVSLIGCDPFTCLGYADDGFVSYGADGSRPLRATGVAVKPTGRYEAFFDSTGRFVQVRGPRAGSPASDPVHLWDRRTNTVGRQQENLAAIGGDLIDLGQHGRKQRLLDLKRIR
jgi:hypothetical protein